MNTMVVVLIISNFWVQAHEIDNGKHNYLLKGWMNLTENDCGVTHLVSYSGPALPVDDSKKFYAEILAECTMEDSTDVRYRLCEAVSISF